MARLGGRCRAVARAFAAWLRPVAHVLSGAASRLAAPFRFAGEKLPQMMKLKPQSEAKILVNSMKSMVNPAQKVASKVAAGKSALLDSVREGGDHVEAAPGDKEQKCE